MGWRTDGRLHPLVVTKNISLRMAIQSFHCTFVVVEGSIKQLIETHIQDSSCIAG
jgi:hypothetical protein